MHLSQLLNHVLVLAFAFPRLEDGDGAVIFGVGVLKVPVKACSQYLLPPLTSLQHAVPRSHRLQVNAPQPFHFHCDRCLGGPAQRENEIKPPTIQALIKIL